LEPAVRADLCDRLAAAGLKRIEAASFVNPKLVPQMAGADGLERPAPASSDYRPMTSTVLVRLRSPERNRSADTGTPSSPATA
jgi:hypothetical protein